MLERESSIRRNMKTYLAYLVFQWNDPYTIKLLCLGNTVVLVNFIKPTALDNFVLCNCNG